MWLLPGSMQSDLGFCTAAPMGQPPLGAPPGAPQPPAGGPDGPPDAKRARTEFVLEDEAEFLQRHPGASKVGRVQAFCCQACI